MWWNFFFTIGVVNVKCVLYYYRWHSFSIGIANKYNNSTLTIVFPVGYVSYTADGDDLDYVEPVAEVDEQRGVTAARRPVGGVLAGQDADEVVVVHLSDDHARSDVERDRDPPHVSLRRDAGDGANRRNDVVDL